MKKQNLLFAILFGIALLFSILSNAFAQSAYGEHSGFEIAYMVLLAMAIAMLIYSIRIPMHANAALLIGFLAIIIKFIYWGIYQINAFQAGENDGVSLFTGIMNILFAFVAFDALAFSIHNFLGLAKFNKIALAIDLATFVIIFILLVATSIHDFSALPANNPGPTILALVFEKLALAATAVVPAFSTVIIWKQMHPENKKA